MIVKASGPPLEAPKRNLGGLVFLSPALALALGIEGSSHDPKARRREFCAGTPKDLDNKKHKEYKKHMPDNYSVPQVAKKLNVHRNTVIYWINKGYIKATIKNALTPRPQYLISSSEVERVRKLQNVAA